jgi:hypothetical protein
VARNPLEPMAVVDGEHILLVHNGLLRIGASGWVLDRATPDIFSLLRGSDWTALAVRGEPGESDWFDFRRDGEDWRRIEPPPSLLGRRWESVAHDDHSMYVRATSGVIARSDGGPWEQIAMSVESSGAQLVVAGDVLYDWHDGVLDVFEDGAWRRAVDNARIVAAGDAQHVYVHQGSATLLRSTPAGFEPIPGVPGGVLAMRARGAQLAVSVRGENAGIYRFVDDAWQLASREPGLLALDEDGTLLVSDGLGALLVTPDGTARQIGSDVEPVAPLRGDSLQRLFAPAARGGLLRLAGDHWELVAGTAELRISALWSAPDGTVFFVTDSDVYRLDHDGPEPLGSPAEGRAIGLVGRSATEVYLTTVDEAQTYLRVYRWDGSSWSSLDALTLALGELRPGAPYLFGSRGFLLALRGVNAPDDDPVTYWQALASTGDAWIAVAGENEYSVDNVTAVQMGTTASPSAMLLVADEGELRYAVLDENNLREFAAEGTFDLQLSGAIAGTDLDHMVGLARIDGVTRFAVRDGGDWRMLGAGQLEGGLSGPPVGWYGSDAVGVASVSGVSLCER